MKRFSSKSSVFVKIVTVGTLILLTLMVIFLWLSDNSFSKIGGVALMILTFGFAAYFFGQSLNNLILDNEDVILKKNLWQIEIAKKDIKAITRMKYSNLTMTIGSKGFFGFIGSLMDGSYSMVKNRHQMVRITTTNKNYLISVDDPEKLIAKIKG